MVLFQATAANRDASISTAKHLAPVCQFYGLKLYHDDINPNAHNQVR